MVKDVELSRSAGEVPKGLGSVRAATAARRASVIAIPALTSSCEELRGRPRSRRGPVPGDDANWRRLARPARRAERQRRSARQPARSGGGIESGLRRGRRAFGGNGQGRERETGRSVQLVADHAHQDARARREGRRRSRGRRVRTLMKGWTVAGRQGVQAPPAMVRSLALPCCEETRGRRRSRRGPVPGEDANWRRLARPDRLAERQRRSARQPARSGAGLSPDSVAEGRHSAETARIGSAKRVVASSSWPIMRMRVHERDERGIAGREAGPDGPTDRRRPARTSRSCQP